MDPERPELETLESAELRKRLLEEAAQAQAHRAAGTDEESRHHGPEPEWKPPKELAGGKGGQVFVRFAIFVLLLLGIYFLVRQGSYIVFQPELVALDAVTPEGRIAPGQPIRLAVRVANATDVEATSFVVAALPGGQEVAGTPVTIGANDTVSVPVDVRLPVGDHVVSVVAFQGGREEDRRLGTWSGINVWVGDREIALEGVSLPETMARSDTLVVDFSGTNPGGSPETVVPVLIFGSESGELTEVDGPVAELPPGETTPLQITIVAAGLEPGRYTVRLLARTPTGERLASQDLPSPVEVRDP